MIVKTLIFAAAFGSWGMQNMITFADAKVTTKIFQHEAAVKSHTVHFSEQRDSLDGENEGDAAASSDHEEEGDDDDDDDEKDDMNDVLHQPSGQHLLVDIKHVDGQFLNSEKRLAEAVVDLIEEANVTMLSYHCHSLVVGVSCVAVLLESHLAIHTFPADGIIIMDLFTCGPKPLIPTLPVIKKLFAIPSHSLGGEDDEEPPEPRMIWSHKRRGFREGFDPNWDRYANPLDQGLGIDMIRKHDLDMKVPLVSEGTDFQHVDIVELIDPRVRSLASYERSLSNDGSYESLHPEKFRPDKVLFLDGVQQSTLYGEAEYHEALVHPAMITHPNPKRVAIIGGGEGATLREVLKHNTVKEAMMVEIDGGLVELCKEYLPEWSNCSDIVGSDADSCFDDSRASVAYDDAFGWFINSYGEGNNKKEEKFDVIIMDALDPDKFVEIVGSLYKDNQFVEALFQGLSEEGVFVAQLGETDQIGDPAVETGPFKDKANMMESLKSVGFQSMHIYDEGHPHFEAPWNILVAFKGYKSRASWYKTSAEIEIEIHRRLHRTKSGKPPLLYFDGSTMMNYQMPPKAQETVYCRREATPWECDIPMSHPASQKSAGGDKNEDSTHDMNESAEAFHVLPSTWSVINDLHERTHDNEDEFSFVEDELSSVANFVEGYGHGTMQLGKKHFTVDAGMFTTNTNNCGDNGVEFTETTENLGQRTVYSPVLERHLRQITAVTRLHGQCSGENTGDITELELEA